MKKIYIFMVIAVGVLGFFGLAGAQTCPAGSVCLKNPLGNKVEATVIIGTIIRGALGILGSLALLMLVWGGFQWLTSAGNNEKVEKGTQTMMWAVIGVIVVLSSFVLVETLTRVLTQGQ